MEMTDVRKSVRELKRLMKEEAEAILYDSYVNYTCPICGCDCTEDDDCGCGDELNGGRD